MAFNPNPSSLPLIKEDRTQILNATLSFLSTNPSIKTHSLHGNLLANLLNASPVDFPMNASDNKPPALTPWFSSFKKPDPLTDRQNGSENNQIKPLQVTLGLNNMLLPISKNSISPSEESFIRVKEDYIKLQDVDFWLVFEKKQVTMKVENFLEDLKNQFESINIVKIKQFYFLDKRNSDLLVTGWKLFDETLVHDIINQTKKLLLTSSNQKLDFQIIQSATDLRRHLRKVVLDKKLELLDLFNEQFAKPLFKLQVQGLVYYEFDYVDLCPETLCILCGLPPSTTDAELLDCFTHHVLPKPMNILRNPTSEGQTTVRVSFAERSAADLLRFQGLKVPVAGEFHFKPLILIPIKSRNFDYLSELVKFQVKINFETNEKLERQTLVKYMKELELRYGSISDVNMIEETCCIVSFTQISSAGKCLDSAKFEEFSLKAVMSKPKKAYPCSGYLFQSELENARNDFVIQRPPPLVKADPAQFKIPSKFFEKKLNLKKRYQKIYLTQQRESSRRKESKDLEKVEENSPSISDFKYEQILTEGVVNHEQDHSHSTKNSKAEEISSNLIQTTEKTAKELIAEISKPSSINTKRPPLSPSVDSEVENDDVPEPEIEPEEDESFEDFHIKILQPITDELELQNHQAKMEEHDQSTEVEQNDSKLIAKASKPTKKLKTESRVSPKIKLENKLRNNPKTKGGASIRTGKYLKKAVEDQGTPKRSERLALKADKGGSKIYASLLKSYNKKKKEIKQKRKALAKTKKRAQKRGPIEDNLYTRESPLINFMMNNFVKNEEQHEEEEEINIKNEDIRNIKIEVKKELIEEEFGFRVEIEVPDMKALFLPRELRQVKMVSSRYLMKKPTHSKQFKPYKPYKEPKAAEIEDKTKLLIQQNIEKIRNLIEINEDIRRKKQADEKETKVKVEEF